MNVGDLLGSGTISGPEKHQRGSLLEISWNGTEPVDLAGGIKRTFLEDGDSLVMRGWCQGNGYRVGFGEVEGTICRRSDARTGPADCRGATCDEAIQLRAGSKLDCFASLAMTSARRVLPLRRRNIPESGPQCAAISSRLYFRCTRWSDGDCFAACRRPAAIHARAGSAVGQSRRRSSGRHCAAWSRRSRRRRCIRRSRCAPPSRSAEGPCRNIRSSAGVAAPWRSPSVLMRPTIANHCTGDE